MHTAQKPRSECNVSGLSRRLCSGLITLDYYTLPDVVRGLTENLHLTSQRRSGNLGFRTFHAEQ